MQASIDLCLSQARINWEGYAAGRASGVIWGGLGVGAPLVLVGVASTGTVGASASIIFPGGRVMGVGAPFGWDDTHPDCQFLCLHYLPLLHKNPEDVHDGVQ